MIGIICAMQLEADGIIALAESIETEEIYGMTFRRGTLGGQDVTVVVCGEGKVNAAMCATSTAALRARCHRLSASAISSSAARSSSTI